MWGKLLQKLNQNKDKAIHFSGGYIIATVLPVTPMWGLAIAVVAGIVKEIYDSEDEDDHAVDKCDTYATWLGGFAGFATLISK